MKGVVILLLIAVFMGREAAAQRCTQPGQNPTTAFPVCGTSVFTQTKVPICGDREVPSLCNNVPLTDKNPFWYRFICYTGGTLGFKITPNNLADDYDWQLFDITNELPNMVYSKESLFVACNWSGEPGVTGASSAGRLLTICEGEGRPLFSSMPTLVAGHEYLLLVSHFTDTQSGYTLEFGGGSADITDPKMPALLAATGACTGNELRIKLNKEVKCQSIAANGSDFSIANGLANVTKAAATVCSDGFSTDSIVLTLDKVLEPGNHTVNVKTGSDGNSLLDNCDNNMADGSIGFNVPQNVSAQFKYVLREGCETDTVEFSHDGANDTHTWKWIIDGQEISGRSASMVFSSTGSKQVMLSVANDYCTDTQLEEVAIPPKVQASFLFPEMACATDFVNLVDNSVGNIATWMWNLGDGSTSSQKNPEPFKYPRMEGEKNYTVRLS